MDGFCNILWSDCASLFPSCCALIFERPYHDHCFERRTESSKATRGNHKVSCLRSQGCIRVRERQDDQNDPEHDATLPPHHAADWDLYPVHCLLWACVSKECLLPVARFLTSLLTPHVSHELLLPDFNVATISLYFLSHFLLIKQSS